MSALTQMEQLAAFADFEERYNPHPDGHKHIATWAMEEIRRLRGLLLKESEIGTIAHASEELETLSHYSGSDYQKRLATLAAALRSITDERKV